ncbi:MAG: hypothetical protein WBB23_13690, partial [Desulforhopalus sp.]
ELVLRFFAYAYNYKNFDHSVADFLSKYMKEMNKRTDFKKEKQDFHEMLQFAQRILGHGFPRSITHLTTPRVRFESLSVGIHLALKTKPDLTIPDDMTWLNSPEFQRHTRSDASNSKPKVVARVEYVRDKILGKG